MTSGVILEAKIVIVGTSKVAVIKIDAVDVIEFKRWVNLQRKGEIILRMDEIENRRGFNTGLRILKALLHGSEPNNHSKYIPRRKPSGNQKHVPP